MKNYGSRTSSDEINFFNKNKQEKTNKELDFIAIKKNLSKAREFHKQMFDPKDHPHFKKIKMYH